MSRFGRAKQKKWSPPTNPLEAEATKGVIEDLPGRKFNNKDLYIAQRIDKLSVVTNPSPAQTAELNALVKIRADSQLEAFEASQDDSFASDFQNFLQGRMKIEEAKRVNWPVNTVTAYDGTGAPVLPPAQAQSTLRLNHLPGVQGYLDKFIDARLRYEQAIERMKKLGPVGLDGKVDLDVLYVYYKYVVRGTSVGEDEFLRDWKFFEKRGPKPPGTLAEQLADTNELNAQADERMGHMVPDNSVGAPGDAMGNNVVGNVANSEVPTPVQIVPSSDYDQEEIAGATAAARAGVVDQSTMKEFTKAGKEFAAAAKQLGKNKADNTAMVAQLKSLSDAVGLLHGKLLTSDPGIAELKEALTVGPDSLVELMKEVASSSRSLHNDLSDLPTKFENLPKKIEEAIKLGGGGGQGGTGTSGMSPDVKAQFDDLTFKLAALEAKADSLESTNNDLATQLGEAETDKDDALTDMSKRMERQQKAAVKSVEDAALARIKELSDELNSLKTAQEAAIKAKDDLIATLESEEKKKSEDDEEAEERAHQRKVKEARRQAELTRIASGQAAPEKSGIDKLADLMALERMEAMEERRRAREKKAKRAAPTPNKGKAAAPPNNPSSSGSSSAGGITQRSEKGAGTIRPKPINGPAWYAQFGEPDPEPAPEPPGQPSGKTGRSSRLRRNTRSKGSGLSTRTRRTDFDTKEQEEEAEPGLPEWTKDKTDSGPREKTPRGGVVSSVAAGIKAAGGYTAETLAGLGHQITAAISKKLAERNKTMGTIQNQPDPNAGLGKLASGRKKEIDAEITRLRQQQAEIEAEKQKRGDDALIHDDDDDDFVDAATIPSVRGGRFPTPPGKAVTPSPRATIPRPPGSGGSRGTIPPHPAPKPHDIPGSVVRNNPVPPRGGPTVSFKEPKADNPAHAGQLAQLKLITSTIRKKGGNPEDLVDVEDYFNEHIDVVGTLDPDEDLKRASGMISFIENEVSEKERRANPSLDAIRDYLLTRQFALRAIIRERVANVPVEPVPVQDSTAVPTPLPTGGTSVAPTETTAGSNGRPGQPPRPTSIADSNADLNSTTTGATSVAQPPAPQPGDGGSSSGGSSAPDPGRRNSDDSYGMGEPIEIPEGATGIGPEPTNAPPEKGKGHKAPRSFEDTLLEARDLYGGKNLFGLNEVLMEEEDEDMIAAIAQLINDREVVEELHENEETGMQSRPTPRGSGLNRISKIKPKQDVHELAKQLGLTAAFAAGAIRDFTTANSTFTTDSEVNEQIAGQIEQDVEAARPGDVESAKESDQINFGTERFYHAVGDENLSTRDSYKYDWHDELGRKQTDTITREQRQRLRERWKAHLRAAAAQGKLDFDTPSQKRLVSMMASLTHESGSRGLMQKKVDFIRWVDEEGRSHEAVRPDPAAVDEDWVIWNQLSLANILLKKYSRHTKRTLEDTLSPRSRRTTKRSSTTHGT